MAHELAGLQSKTRPSEERRLLHILRNRWRELRPALPLALVSVAQFLFEPLDHLVAHRVQRLLLLVQTVDQIAAAFGQGEPRAQLVHVERLEHDVGRAVRHLVFDRIAAGVRGDDAREDVRLQPPRFAPTVMPSCSGMCMSVISRSRGSDAR